MRNSNKRQRTYGRILNHYADNRCTVPQAIRQTKGTSCTYASQTVAYYNPNLNKYFIFDYYTIFKRSFSFRIKNIGEESDFLAIILQCLTHMYLKFLSLAKDLALLKRVLLRCVR